MNNSQQQQQVQGVQQRYYGKFRGKVINNVDPLFLGRIQANVPAIMNMELNWAMPCSPYAGPGVGFFAIPPIGASVWIEFEQGDPHYPIWVGCFWEEGEMPFEPAIPETKMWKTESITMELNDVPEIGGFSLYVNPPAVDIPTSMVFNSEGITITCPPGTIVMTPEAITTTLPPSTITLTEEAIEIAIPASTITLTSELIAAESPDISLTAEAGIEATAGADVAISAGAAIEISAGADVSIEAGAAAEVTAGADVALTAGGAAEVTAGADVAITAGLAAEVTAGLDIAISAAAAIEITAVGDVAITAVTTMITSVCEVNGALLEDGMPVMVIPI